MIKIKMMLALVFRYIREVYQIIDYFLLISVYTTYLYTAAIVCTSIPGLQMKMLRIVMFQVSSQTACLYMLPV